VVLEVSASRGDRRERILNFRQVQGDFERFEGRWVVEPDCDSPGSATRLLWQATLRPKVSLPGALLSRVVAAGLPANLMAIARHAERVVARSGLSPADFPGAGGAGPEGLGGAPEAAEGEGGGEGRGLLQLKPWEVSEEALQLIKDAVREQANRSSPAVARPRRFDPFTLGERGGPANYLGTDAVPLPGAAGGAPSGAPRPGGTTSAWEQELVEQIRQGELPGLSEGMTTVVTVPGNRSEIPSTASLPPASPGEGLPEVRRKGAYPAFDVGNSRILSDVEVHLRRLDDDDFLHMRIVATLRVMTAPGVLWDVLTAYESLSDFLPNLAVSEVVPVPRGRDAAGVKRLRQVAFKEMVYMVLHAEAHLDVVERREAGEVQFRMVQGDVHLLQGKWMLQAEERDRCVARLAVEVKLRRSVRSMVFEPFIEVAVFEDLAANMGALKRRAEEHGKRRGLGERLARLEGEGSPDALKEAESLRQKMSRTFSPRELRESLGLLCVELRREFGEAGADGEMRMPRRDELRERGRSDLERAIAAHGGSRKVAKAVGWVGGKKRKPKGYWNDLGNLERELAAFIAEQALPAGVVPSKAQMLDAGRRDLAKAIERLGGANEVADMFRMEVQGAGGASNSRWQQHVSQVAEDTGLSGSNGLFELAARTYESVDLDDDLDPGVAVDPGAPGGYGGGGPPGRAAPASPLAAPEDPDERSGRTPVPLGVSGPGWGRLNPLDEVDWGSMSEGENDSPRGPRPPSRDAGAEDAVAKEAADRANGRVSRVASQGMNGLRVGTKRIDWRGDLRKL